MAIKHSYSGTATGHWRAVCLLVTAATTLPPALAQPSTAPPSSSPPIIFRPPPPPPPPPPPAVIFTPPPAPPTITPLIPTDVTTPTGDVLQQGTGAGAAPIGVFPLKEGQFPNRERAGQNAEGILVKAVPDSQYGQPRGNVVDFKSGSVLVGVQRPTDQAFIDTPFGEIALEPDAAVIVRYDSGILRLLNLTGRHKRVKVRLDRGPFAGAQKAEVGLEPGYELVAADRKLERRDLRLNDGIARRNVSYLSKDCLAVSEFSLESTITGSELIASLQQEDAGAKEQRVIADMSKLAAVINQIRGAYGFVAETSK